MDWNFLFYSLIVVVFTGGVILVWWYQSNVSVRLTNKNRQKYLKFWQKIKNLENPREQVMEADKLLYQLLADQGFSGSVAEKLKAAKHKFTDLDAVWRAHKLRNKIAHEIDFHCSKKEVDLALSAFARAYKDLGLK